MSLLRFLKPNILDTLKAGYDAKSLRGDIFGGLTAAVVVSGLRSHALQALSGMGVLDRVPADQQFENRKGAIKAAVEYCRAKTRDAPSRP